jgi:hypothetical protein
MTLERLIDIRNKLALLTQPESETTASGSPETPKSERETRIEKEIAAAVASLDSLIAEARKELVTGPSFESELRRTTSQPLKPPAEGGPHEIKWGF